jgi:hypothetical protein
MGDVVILGGETKLPIPVERVLDGAKECDYVLVLGWKGEEMWTASSDGDLAKALWLATKFIHKIHAGDYG